VRRLSQRPVARQSAARAVRFHSSPSGRPSWAISSWCIMPSSWGCAVVEIAAAQHREELDGEGVGRHQGDAVGPAPSGEHSALGEAGGASPGAGFCTLFGARAEVPVRPSSVDRNQVTRFDVAALLVQGVVEEFGGQGGCISVGQRCATVEEQSFDVDQQSAAHQRAIGPQSVRPGEAARPCTMKRG
jgi:hypothetical protein